MKGVQVHPDHLRLDNSISTNDNYSCQWHWFIIAGFERAANGSPGLAEKSEILKQNDIIAGVNDISFMNKTFHKCIQALRIAEWPLTLHILRNPEVKDTMIEGWVIRVLENSQPLLSRKDAIRLAWQNQNPQNTSYRCYLELLENNNLTLRRPTRGGGMTHQIERYWSMSNAIIVRRVCEKSDITTTSPRWCVDVGLGINSVETTIRIQLNGRDEMHSWGDALENAARLSLEPTNELSREPKPLGSDRNGIALDKATEFQIDRNSPVLTMQPTSVLDNSKIGSTLNADTRNYNIKDKIENDKASNAPRIEDIESSGNLYKGLEIVTRFEEELSNRSVDEFRSAEWLAKSIVFQKRAPLNLVVKGVEKLTNTLDDEQAQGGHWIVVSGFTNIKTTNGHTLGLAESSGRIYKSDIIVGINNRSLPEFGSFNDFAHTVRGAQWPLTLNLLRDVRANPSDTEGWVVHCSLNYMTHDASTDHIVKVARGNSSQRYLSLYGQHLYYHTAVNGGAMRARPQGKWVLSDVDCLLGVFDKNAPEGERWIVVLKLRTPVSLKSTSEASSRMIGHASFTIATEMHMREWLFHLANYPFYQKRRSGGVSSHQEGALKQQTLQHLIVLPKIVTLDIKPADHAAGGKSGRSSALENSIDSFFHSDYDDLLVTHEMMLNKYGESTYIPPKRLDGRQPISTAIPPLGFAVTSGGNLRNSNEIVSNSNNATSDNEVHTFSGKAFSRALDENDKKVAQELLISALHTTKQVEESSTLCDALLKYKQQLNGYLSIPDTMLLLSIIGVPCAESKLNTDERTLVEEINERIRR